MSVVPIRPPVTIGGSDAAAACGIDPFRSRVMLWCEKTGRVERPESEAMTWGKRLEPVVMEVLEARGYIIHPAPAYTDGARAWLTGHPDGFVGHQGESDGRPELLEVKTAGVWSSRDWNGGGVPIHYQAQVQHYLHLTGLTRALVACLVGGQRLEVREVERDDRAIETLLALEEEFFSYIASDRPPPPDGSASAKEALAALHPSATTGKVARLSGALWDDLRALRAREEQLAVVERQRDELKQRIQAEMGDAEVAISPHDTEVAKWTNVTSHRLDTARIRKERPDLYDTYGVASESRRFTLT